MRFGLSDRLQLLIAVTALGVAASRSTAQLPRSSPKQAPPMVSRDACRFLTPVALDAVVAQPKGDSKPAPASGDDEFGLKLPEKDHLFRVESEEAFRNRLRQELPKVKNVQFPKDVPFGQESKSTEGLPQRSVGPVSDPICYRPLYFEDKRAERFGQNVPCLQPVVSTSRFYADVLKLPYHIIIAPPWIFECDNR